MPGHEFTGVVTGTGREVTTFSVGDRVAVGNIVDSCGVCAMCEAGQENFCHSFPTLTYGGTDRQDGSATLGGYSREYVVRDAFAYPLPSGLDPAAAAPLMCAGVTVWEPLRSLGVGPGSRVAVAGLGGLGHLAVKMAVALGATTTVISRTQDKRDDARKLGAHDLIASTDTQQMATARDTFDVVIDTVSAPHELAPYLKLVAMDGTLSLLGYLGPVTVEAMDLLVGRKKLSPRAAEDARRQPRCFGSAPTTASPPTSKYSRRHRWTRHSTASGETTSATASCSTCPIWTEETGLPDMFARTLGGGARSGPFVSPGGASPRGRCGGSGSRRRTPRGPCSRRRGRPRPRQPCGARTP